MKTVPALLLVSLFLLGCNNKGAGTFSTRPSFSTGSLDVYIALGYIPAEEYLIREAVKEHVQEYQTSAFKKGPWKTIIQGGRTWTLKPRIFIAGPKIKYLSAPYRLGVEGYADFKKWKVVVVSGQKYTCPALFRELHHFKHGPDPYYQDPLLMWGAVASVGSRIVADLRAKR